jgi:hypothetical protein
MDGFLMQRQDYLKLRFSVEQEVSSSMDNEVEAKLLVNNVMRLFLHSIISTQLKRHKVTQQFNDFKRSNQTPMPSWAFNNPGLSDRIPTLKEA